MPNGKLAEFVCQINLGEIEPVVGSPLPTEGLLSLFVFEDNRPASLAQAVMLYERSLGDLIPPLTCADVPEYEHPDWITPFFLDPTWGIDFSMNWKTVSRPCEQTMPDDREMPFRLIDLHQGLRRWKAQTWISRRLGLACLDDKAAPMQSSSWFAQTFGNAKFDPFGKLLGATEEDLRPQAELVTRGLGEILYDWDANDDRLKERFESKVESLRKSGYIIEATIETYMAETLLKHDLVRAFRAEHGSFKLACEEWQLLFEIDSNPVVGLNIWDAWTWKVFVKTQDIQRADFGSKYFCAHP
jgi:hypothetical protein